MAALKLQSGYRRELYDLQVLVIDDNAPGICSGQTGRNRLRSYAIKAPAFLLLLHFLELLGKSGTVSEAFIGLDSLLS